MGNLQNFELSYFALFLVSNFVGRQRTTWCGRGALAKHGRKMADTENYPASRHVVEKSQWRTAFLKIRIDSDVKEASVKKDFERQSTKLQEDGFIHSYEDKVWIVHDEDRQDI